MTPAFAGFRDVGSRPEELAKAVRQLQDEIAAGRAADADTAFATICATLATAAAELDVQSIQDAGELAVLVFSRIATGQARGLYAADTLVSFSKTLGRAISANDITPALDKLVWLRHLQTRQSLSGE